MPDIINYWYWFRFIGKDGAKYLGCYISTNPILALIGFIRQKELDDNDILSMRRGGRAKPKDYAKIKEGR